MEGGRQKKAYETKLKPPSETGMPGGRPRWKGK